MKGHRAGPILGWLVRKTSLTGSARTSLLSPNWLSSRPLYRSVEHGVRYASGVVLDIGCGTMPYRFLFESSSEVMRYVGLDYPATKASRDTAMQNNLISDAVFSEWKPDVYSTALRLPFASDSIDTALSFQVLEHVPQPDAMMSEINRVLIDGGAAIISTNFVWPLHEEPFDFFRFSKYGLTRLFERNGFKVLELHAVGGAWVTWGQWLTTQLANAFIRRGVKALFLPVGICMQAMFTLLERIQFLEGAAGHYLAIARKTGRAA